MIKTIIITQTAHKLIQSLKQCRQTVRDMPFCREVPVLSERRPGFSPRSANVGFMVDRVSLENDFFRVLQLCPVSVISCSTLIHRLSTSLNNALGARRHGTHMEGAKEAYRGTAPVSALFRRQCINLAVYKNREINHK